MANVSENSQHTIEKDGFSAYGARWWSTNERPPRTMSQQKRLRDTTDLLKLTMCTRMLCHGRSTYSVCKGTLMSRHPL